MSSNRITVIGGGPAGLFFALLLKKADPRRDIVVLERLTQIAPYKCPRAIEFVGALPRTNTGKLQRFKLRESEKAAP